jgi:hypothetical protein
MRGTARGFARTSSSGLGVIVRSSKVRRDVCTLQFNTAYSVCVPGEAQIVSAARRRRQPGVHLGCRRRPAWWVPCRTLDLTGAQRSAKLH